MEEVVCSRCGFEGPHAVRTVVSSPHHARLDCGECGRFLQWLAKPDQDKAKRPARHRNLVRKYSQGYCELCLRREEALPRGEVLEGHHVKEYCEEGEPARENVWIVCSFCHSLITTMRTYLGHYAPEEEPQ